MKIEFDPFNCTNKEALTILSILIDVLPITYIESNDKEFVVESAYCCYEGIRLVGIEKPSREK
jgi:hypothetical protein